MGSLAGGVLGAGVGAFAGDQGSKLSAMTAGAVIGGILGGTIGTLKDLGDRKRCEQATQQALSSSEPVEWRNPKTQHYGYVVPQPIMYTPQNVLCRPFTMNVHTEDGPQTYHGMAEFRNGSWRIVSIKQGNERRAYPQSHPPYNPYSY